MLLRSRGTELPYATMRSHGTEIAYAGCALSSGWVSNDEVCARPHFAFDFAPARINSVSRSGPVQTVSCVLLSRGHVCMYAHARVSGGVHVRVHRLKH
eukprot:2922286-Rhodomonas_salina.1